MRLSNFLKVLVIVPSRLLLEQFAVELPNFCKVGTGYNKNINSRAPGFIAVSDSVHLLEKMPFEAVFVDEAHHPLPPGMPDSKELFQFSATCPNTADNMGQAIEEGVLCDYDLTVPVAAGGHAYASLAALLVSHRGRFRRVLAYCNDVAEAKRVQRTFLAAGIAAWHINAGTRRKRRQEVIQEFSGRMRKPVHALVTVRVLGEGVNIPNADTCMFVEPRDSYTSIVQAVGRVLRQHIAKPIAHIILPAMTLPAEAHTVAGSFSKRELTNTAYSAPWDLDEQPVASSLVNRSMQSGIKLRQTSAVGDVGVQDTQNALALGSTPHSAQVEPCSNDASSRGKALSTVAKCKQDSIKGDGLLVRDEADTQHKEATGTTGPEKQFAELDSSERASG